MMKMKWMSVYSAVICVTVSVLPACKSAKDVPPPNDPQAIEWTPKIRSAYPSWQAPQTMPAENPEYRETLAALNTRTAPDSDASDADVIVLQETVVAPVPPVAAPPVKKAPVAKIKMIVDSDKPATEYTVNKGDTLSLIAKKQYKDGNLWRILFEANKTALKDNPNKLNPGMKLSIPAIKESGSVSK